MLLNNVYLDEQLIFYSLLSECRTVMSGLDYISKKKCLFLMACAVFLCSCASEYTVLNSVADIMQSLHSGDEFVIGHGDRLRIDVWGQENLDSDVIVQPDGKISLPLVEDLPAAGLTIDALRQELDKRYREFILEPTVSVTVSEINSLKIYVLGEVNSPGEIDLLSYTDVLQAIAKAGGFTIYAKKNKVEIIRTFGGQKIKTRFNYSQVVRGKNLQQNIPLKPGDVIIVP